MNYYERQMIFEKEDGWKIKFVRECRKAPTKITSAMTTMKYLRKGCEAYLAFVIDKKKEGLTLKELPVVNEFKD